MSCKWGLRLFLLLTAAALCFARNPILLTEEYAKGRFVVERRSLKVQTDDYGDPSANQCHNPPVPEKKTGGRDKGRAGGGRKG